MDSDFQVYRRFKDFLSLSEKLSSSYSHTCVIIPPPPKKNQTASVWSKVSDLNNSGLDRVIALRCKELDRYINRLARHPVLRKDPDFRSFLQEAKLSVSFHAKKSLKESWSSKLAKFGLKRDKMLVKDADLWFKTRTLHQEELRNQLATLRKDIRAMSEEKMELFVATTTFRRNLLELVTVGDSQRKSMRNLKETEGNELLRKVADIQNGMADLYINQAEADDLLAYLAVDYSRIIDSVDHSMAVRLKALRDLQKLEKKQSKTTEKLEELDEQQAAFDRLSQTLRRELEHFDTNMEAEFDETFKNYHKQYTASLEYGGIDTTKYK